MPTLAAGSVRCHYCGSAACRIQYENVFHPRAAWHGPFDLYRCSDCGSQATFPVPDAERLNAFYAQYEDGLPPELVRAREASPQHRLYEHLIDRYVAATGRTREASFTWMDLASGTGIFARLMAERFPRSHGIGVDLHDAPSFVAGDDVVTWHQADLNDPAAYAALPSVDAVFANAVLEHVRDPEAFLLAALGLLATGGTLYVFVPDNASLAARVLRKRWPYYSPGEHLHVPSVRGARALARRLAARTGRRARVAARPVSVPYTLQYVGAYLHVEPLVRGVVGPRAAIPLPTGALDLIVTLD